MDTTSTKQSSNESKVSYTTQYLATISATFSTMSAGAVVGYSSPAMPRLIEPISSADGSLRLTQNQANWFSSAINLSAALGAFVGGYAMNKIGRRITIILDTLIFATGWILIVTATNYAMLMTGRVIGGLAFGISLIVIPTFIGETVSADIRGLLASLVRVMAAVGNIWGYALGALISSWRWLAVAMAIPPFLCFFCMFFVKETPLYLLSKSKVNQANKSLKFYRGEHYDCASELEELRQFLEMTLKNKASVKDLLKPHNLKPFLLYLTILIFTICSGQPVVVFFLFTIFEDAGTNLSEDMSSIIIGMVQILASIGAAFLMDRAGRKLLFIIGAAVTCVSLSALAGYFYMKDQDSEWASETLGWLPLTSLIIFMTAVNLGFITVQYVMLAEFFSPEVKGIAAGIAMLPALLLAFVIITTFVPMKNAIGDYGVYWIFSGMCFLALIFGVVFVPETKGKTLQEITEYFGGPSAKDNTK